MTNEQANASVASLAAARNDRWYPTFHIAARAGWINDPNGLIYFNGLYHVFYQHHPYSAVWGPMHWGHATSKDMVTWTDAGVALAPSIAEDAGGVWSGSAVEHDGKLYVFYTGNQWKNGVDGEEGIIQTQCMAVSDDGFAFTKLGPVIAPPEGVENIRDPKVWREGEQWRMVLGASSPSGRGQIWMYVSDNLTDWAFDRVIFEDPDPNVWMIECPDLFPLDGRWVIAYGPMLKEARRTGYLNRNGHNTGYVVGDWSAGKEFVPSCEYRQYDLGHNFYAPQTFLAADARRIMFGWMGGFTLPLASQADGWSGNLALPRELRLEKDRLIATPIGELSRLRTAHEDLAPFTLGADEERQIRADAGPCEIEFEVDLRATSAEQVCLTVHGQTVISYDSLAERVSLDLGHGRAGQRGYRAAPFAGDVLKLRVFVDRGSVEVFIEGTGYSLSSMSFPENPRDLFVSTVAGGASVTRLVVHDFGRIYESGNL